MHNRGSTINGESETTLKKKKEHKNGHCVRD
jgi:hypothetical protein